MDQGREKDAAYLRLAQHIAFMNEKVYNNHGITEERMEAGNVFHSNAVPLKNVSDRIRFHAEAGNTRNSPQGAAREGEHSNTRTLEHSNTRTLEHSTLEHSLNR